MLLDLPPSVGVEITDKSAEQIRKRAIERTTQLLVSDSLSEGYADTREELDAIEPCELSLVCEQEIDEFRALDHRQRDRIVDELLFRINQTL